MTVGIAQLDPGASDGFTMLEVLIGIMLSTLLLLLLSEVAFFANLSFSEVRQAAARQQNDIVFHRTLAQSLESAYPYRNPDDSAAQSGVFAGTNGVVRYSAYSAHRPRTLFEVRVAPDKLTLLEAGAIKAEKPIGAIPLDGARANTVCLRYFGVQQGQGRPTWSGSWAADGRLPVLLAITSQCDELNLAPSTEFWWEFFSLPVTASGACEFDQLLQRCRGDI